MGFSHRNKIRIIKVLEEQGGKFYEEPPVKKQLLAKNFLDVRRTDTVIQGIRMVSDNICPNRNTPDMS